MQLRRNTWVRKLREFSVMGVKTGGTYREKSCNAIHYNSELVVSTDMANHGKPILKNFASKLCPRMGFCEIRHVALVDIYNLS